MPDQAREVRRPAATFKRRRRKLSPKRQAELAQILLSQARQNLEVDIVLREQLGVLTEPNAVQPLCDLRHGPPQPKRRLNSEIYARAG